MTFVPFSQQADLWVESKVDLTSQHGGGRVLNPRLTPVLPRGVLGPNQQLQGKETYKPCRVSILPILLWILQS